MSVSEVFIYNYHYTLINSLVPIYSRKYNFFTNSFFSNATFNFKPVKYPDKIQLRDTFAQIKGQTRPHAEAKSTDFT